MITNELAFLRMVLDFILALFPVSLVRQELDEAAVRRANLAADAAEVVKFRGSK